MSGRFYLRKYQASSAMMSSSRDRTSTVGRMWLLGDVTSSEEEGEAEPGGQGAPSTKEAGREGQGRRYTRICLCVREYLAAFVLEPCARCTD